MSEPSGYLLHGTAFSSKEAAIEMLVHNNEQELRFHKLWDEDAQPYYFESQPQLTIPKSIAEMLDKEIAADAVTKFAMFHEGFERFWLSYELQMYCAKKKDYALVSAYLAGKALGVDLVKVVEG